MRLAAAALWLGLAMAPLAPSAGLAQAEAKLTYVPAFTIWDVKFGAPITQIPLSAVALIACGTNGGPPSVPLRDFTEFATCPAEASGLHEVFFTYDDEQDYIAKALEDEYRFAQGGTSIYAHPVVFTVLVDAAGIARGIRIVTDERAGERDRRVAVRLADNLRGRYSPWSPACEDIPATDGQQPVGSIFIHQICTGTSPDGDATMRLEATYFRKKGQTSISRETQQVQKNYFQSATRLEVVQQPFAPDATPVR
ncbi:MAG: hypothetical protein J0I99_12975 [Devosia sp.]|uniref:hypothetical protein n=1 Tax=Devosia sp. TaxID=1871048 RepID=UPI001ACCF654|nr:hypothetical protein [Devosia sp.]MBN9309921.1 hypothetical protein [Devosia sp.]MBN9316647.1 hypothetical protein [Devosia sp.]